VEEWRVLESGKITPTIPRKRSKEEKLCEVKGNSKKANDLAQLVGKKKGSLILPTPNTRLINVNRYWDTMCETKRRV